MYTSKPKQTAHLLTLRGNTVTERREGERKHGTLRTTGKVIPFIGALVVLAKAGHKPAMKKLDDIQRWLKDIAENF